MRICGVIAEYNPFHNGHALHLKRARALSGAPALAVVMSGCFTQRGEAACCGKRARAAAALAAGADLVAELPFAYACAPAQRFALGGVRLLAGLGCTDFCFGSECGELGALEELAAFLAAEPEALRQGIAQRMAAGFALPKARELAALDCPGAPLDPERRQALLSSPNDGLALEYLRANLALCKPMKPHVVQREVGHHAESVTGDMASGAALRRELAEGGLSAALRRAVTPAMWEGLSRAPRVSGERLEVLLLWALRRAEPEEVRGWFDLPEALANGLYKHRYAGGVADILEAATSRAATASRLRRSWLHGLLGATEADAAALRTAGEPLYARLLGLRRGEVPGEIKRRATVPLIAKAADFRPYGAQSRLWALDCRAAELYALLTGTEPDGDMRAGPVVVERA